MSTFDMSNTGIANVKRYLSDVTINNIYIKSAPVAENHQICPCSKETVNINMMKFPRPRTLTENEYPDITESQPILLRKLVCELINPLPNTPYDKYIDETIKFVF